MTEARETQTPTSITGSMLKLSRLFDGMDDAVLDRMAAELQVDTASPGQVLIAEGQVASHMYVVIAGELEVLKANKTGRNVRMALLGPGDWVGEMSILDVKPRSATVRVVAPSTLVMVSSLDVTRLLREQNIEQYAVFIRNIGRELSRRLRVADGLIAQSATRLAKQYVKQRKSCSD
jgi:CRP/FNR family cyclic AMP-dependent transcriptional regulator